MQESEGKERQNLAMVGALVVLVVGASIAAFVAFGQAVESASQSTDPTVLGFDGVDDDERSDGGDPNGDPGGDGTDPSDTSSGFRADAAWAMPSVAPNPFISAGPAPAMHNDGGSSDVSALPGPRFRSSSAEPTVTIDTIDLQAICPAVLIGSDNYPVALCTGFDGVPIVHLLDPSSGRSLASLPLVVGNIFTGVYGYLDNDDRLVTVDGSNDLLRIAHRQIELNGVSTWVLEIVERSPLGLALAGGSVVSVAPGYGGEVWFAADNAVVGFVDTSAPVDPNAETGVVSIVALGPGERVSNSISTSPAGTAIVTDNALYLVEMNNTANPEIRWRMPYDRGPARKPGQLSHGSGSSPTFFGPTSGFEYLAIVDNANPSVNLMVVSVTGGDSVGVAQRQPGEVVCQIPVLNNGGPGSENSPIGSGNTVIVASTYGYTYPVLPPDAGFSFPYDAAITGGLTRVDLRDDNSGCDLVWESPVRSSAVPKLSLADGAIFTMSRERTPPGSFFPEWFAFTVIDVESGKVTATQMLPDDTGDPLQLAGSLGPDGVLYQGTLGPLLRISSG